MSKSVPISKKYIDELISAVKTALFLVCSLSISLSSLSRPLRQNWDLPIPNMAKKRYSTVAHLIKIAWFDGSIYGRGAICVKL